ncbi:hypothetical protein [Glycomyces sp. NPDC048151]|uniref:hypothetical protein n=1 Tax=Glycomyces sp. NPDC048151 TaxID=3364002 RepID=UPI0037201F5E
MAEFAAPVLVVLFWVLCIGVPGAAVWLAVHYSRKARERHVARLSAWAAHYGFQYWPYDQSALSLSRFAPFSYGSGREARDVLRGTYRGEHMHCFQLRYRTGSGDNETTHDHQVVAISLPASRPPLDIAHENALTRRFGDDIEFENQAFNDLFKIVSASPRFAHDVIHPRTMEWMLADHRARTIRWRFEGAWLMTFRDGPLNLNEVFFLADFLHDVRAQVPKHVWSAQ